MGGVLGKFIKQAPRTLRNCNFAVQDLPAGDAGAVHCLVSALVGLHDGAIQADPGKSSFAARITQDLGVEFHICTGGRIPTHRPGCHGCVRAHLEFVTQQALQRNAQALARYAALCQEARLVPIVEPEVLMDGEHTLERCGEVTEEVLRTVFSQLYTQRVTLESMILKPNMVLPGLTCPRQEAVDQVADATVGCLLRAVPAAVPGIAFLSGGQAPELASARLNAMSVRFKSRLPWALAFSFARAIEQPALEIWQGKEANVLAAQHVLNHRARCDRAARRGEYNAAMDKDMSAIPRIPQLTKPAA